MGVCFIPEYSALHPGLVLRELHEPEVTRQVSMVTVAGRRWSPPLARFIEAIRRYPWSDPGAATIAGAHRSDAQPEVAEALSPAR